MAAPGSSDIDSPSRVDEVMSADEIAEHLRAYQIVTNGHIFYLNYAEILERRSKSRSGNIPYFKEYTECLHKKFDDWRLQSEGSFEDPLFKLVYEARKGCYFLHESPKAELDKIMKSHPSFYEDFFIVPKFKAKPNFSERKVKVAYLPDDYTVEDVKRLLSDCGDIEAVELKRSKDETYAHVTFKNSDCGDIEAVELKRSKDETYAHVTFKNSESAKIAPYVTDLYSTPIQGVVEEDIPPVVEPGDFGIRCVKAMATYTQLHLRYSEPPPSVERHENRSRSKSPGASPSRSVRSRMTEE